MNKKIFTLLFFVFTLISVSAVSAVDLDDNNGTVASSNDADALAIANDVNAIDDLNENDVKFVAVDKNKKNLLSAKENGVLSESDSNILSVSNEDVLAGNTITPTDFTFAAIQTAVDNAKDGDTISLKAGTYLNDENGNINIINKTISIVGVKDSTILDSQNKSGIFYTENNSTNITGIVFMNGVDDMYGGIFFNKVAGNVINCTFKNSRGSYGSAIYFDYSNGNVINCTFTDNSIGSAIRFYVAKSSVINCTFTNNTAGIEGGAIIVISTYCDIINCTFTNNTAETDGGGAISSDSGSCNMFNCTFTDNSAGYVGGAVKLMRFDCSFINCIFANNSGGDEGGAIYLFDSSITVNNCALVNNTASGNSEIYIDAGSFDLNNNWWGSNNPDWAKILGGYVPEVYAVLNLTANPCEISYDKISNITTKFVWNGTNNDATNLLPKRNVKLLSKGNLTETEGDVGLTSIFSAFIKDIYYVNATVDNETLEVNVKVNSSKPIVTNITVNTTSLDLTVGQNDSIIAELNPPEAGNLKYTYDDKIIDIKTNPGGNFTVTALAEGNTNITFSFPGNGDYLPAENKTVTVTVSLNDASVSGEDMALNVGETGAIKYSTNPKGLNVSFAEDNSGIVSVDEQGIVTALKEGTANVTITVGDNKKYALNSTTVAVSVSLNDASVSGEDMALNVGETGAVKYSAVPKGLDVSFVEDDSGVVSVDEHGIVTALKQGSANITITVGDNKKYALNSTIICVNVHGLPSKIIIENDTLDMIIGDVVDPGVTLMPSDAGNLSFTVSDENIVLVNGYGVVTAVGVGNATIFVRFDGNDKYLPSNATITVSVKNALIITAPDVVKYYGGPERFVVNVTDSKGTPLSNKSVTIVINKVKYNRTTDEKGIASMAIVLPSGTYNATVTVDNKTVNSVVNVLTTVNGTDVLKMYKNGTQYYATFIDSEGKYLADGTTVKFNINGVMYERKVSGDKGQAKLNINLPAGKYVITAMNPKTGENASNNVTVLSNIVENYDLTKYYKNASQYSLRLLDDKGNPVGAGVSVQLNINGVFYTKTSDVNGYVKMNINLPPGTYTVTAEYKGLKASNKITVLSVLETKDLVMKYRDGSKFEAKILDGQGRPYAGQTVKFNINGVFYTKTTEADGIARLNINLLPGEYIITSSYNGLNAANKVTISG